MTHVPNGRSVTRLARLRKGPLGAAFAAVFSVTVALPVAYGLLLVWSLSRPERLADSAAWTVLTGAYVVAAAGGLVVNFALYPDVELYSHGLVIRLPGKRVILPWEAVARVRETRGPTLLTLDAPLTPLHRALGALLLSRRPVILLPRRHRRYPQARAVLRDYLPTERFTTR